MGPVADRKILPDLHALPLQMIHFFNQRPGIDHDAVADQAAGAAIQNAGGDEMENERIPLIDDRMAGIGPTLIPHDHIGILREDIDYLPFAFVAPLGADDDEIRHCSLPTLLLPLLNSKKKP
jgi:hypothetical protein